MPLSFTRQISAGTLLGFWNLQEDPEVLQAQLLAIAPSDLLIPHFSNGNRQLQWLGGRLLAYILLQELTPARPCLRAVPGSKPYFDQAGLHLSISHTRRQVVVILSASGPVGIDIEAIHPKVLRVKDKFLSPDEQQAAGGDLHKTLIYWCTKETLYKLYGRKHILFKEHLKVQAFNGLPPGYLQASIQLPFFRKDYSIRYEVGTDFILTYCLDAPG